MSRSSRELVLLNGLHFFNDGYQAALLMLLPIVAASFSMSAAGAGLLASLHLSLGVILPLPAVWLAQRFGRLRLLTAAVFIYSSVMLLLPLVDRVWSLALVSLLTGAAFGVFHPTAFAHVAEISVPRRLGQNMGWFTAVGDVGRTVVTGLVAALIALMHWRTAYGLLAGAALLASVSLAATWALWSKQHRHVRTVEPKPAPRARGERVPIGREFVATCLTGFLDALVGSGLVVFLPFLWTAKGMSLDRSALALTGFFAASLCGKVAIGRLSDRLGKRRSVMCCQAALAVIVMISAIVDHHVSLMILGAAAGLASKGSLPVLMALSAEQLTASARSYGFGWSQIVLGLATALSPLAYGGLQSWVGIEGAFFSMGALAVVNVVLVSVPLGRASGVPGLIHQA